MSLQDAGTIGEGLTLYATATGGITKYLMASLKYAICKACVSNTKQKNERRWTEDDMETVTCKKVRVALLVSAKMDFEKRSNIIKDKNIS